MQKPNNYLEILDVNDSIEDDERIDQIDRTDDDGFEVEDYINKAGESARRRFRRAPDGYFRTRMTISYDGSDFCGWQRQTKQASVQGTLEAALFQIFQTPIKLMGASRTDTGVHAYGQVAHFDSPKDPTNMKLHYALQRYLPHSIVIKDISIAPATFHSIANCSSKTYHYHVLNRTGQSALRHKYTHLVRAPLSVDYLNQATAFLLGRHDYKSFQTSGTEVKGTIRQIFEARWEQLPGETILFRITGDGFLKQMVRNVVGTSIWMCQRKYPPEHMRQILEAKDRREAGPTAPPQGLFLARVHYPEDLDKRCRQIYNSASCLM